MARPNQGAARRAEFLPEIARAFAQLGYRRTTTAELARRCEIRENILYRLWPDKKSMFIASIEYVYELSAGIWEDLLKNDSSGSSAAERLLEYESLHHGEFGFYRIIFAGLSEADDAEIREAIRRTYRRFHDFIRRQIQAHRNGDQPRRTPDAALRAWAFLGLGTVANIGREFGLLMPDERSRLLKTVGRLLLQ